MMVEGTPIAQYWLIPTAIRPKMFTLHPLMSSDEIGERTQKIWDRFYEIGAIWKRFACAPTLRATVAFVLLSKLYRQMYAGTGISTDSVRRKKAKAWARWIARQTRKIFWRDSHAGAHVSAVGTSPVASIATHSALRS